MSASATCGHRKQIEKVTPFYQIEKVTAFYQNLIHVLAVVLSLSELSTPLQCRNVLRWKILSLEELRKVYKLEGVNCLSTTNSLIKHYV